MTTYDLILSPKCQLQFTNLPYAFYSSASPPDQYSFQTAPLRLSPGACFHVELFADSVSQPPFLAEDYYSSIGRGGIGTSWRDLQGAVRVTSITGIIDLAAIWIVVTKDAGQYEQLFDIPPIAPPIISLHPSNITAIAGSTVSLAADGYGMPLMYQWQRNGTNIATATNNVFALTNAQVGDSATYRAVLANSAGASTTAVANVVIQFGTELELQFRPVLTIRGSTGSTYRIEYSQDLSPISWSALTNIVLDASPYYFTDIQAVPQQRRLYRAVSVP
jgi:hypothetical protein